MSRYVFRKDDKITQHGWLDIYDDQGNLLATSEEWAIINEFNLDRMNNHGHKPGQMMPSGDPRWYTHCLWCGQSVEGQKTAYSGGQYHFPVCYEKHFEGLRIPTIKIAWGVDEYGVPEDL